MKQVSEEGFFLQPPDCSRLNARTGSRATFRSEAEGVRKSSVIECMPVEVRGSSTP
jgi:hypothetical protein